MIQPAQLRAARALVNWSQAELAKAAGVSEVTVKNIERGGSDPRIGTVAALREALEHAGVVFIDENGGGAGVRLFKEHLHGWMQCEVPTPGDDEGIFRPFEAQFMARGGPEDMALFSRTAADLSHEIYLISPSATRLLPHLRGDWRDAVNPSLFGWTLLIGSGNPFKRLGIRGPRMREI